MSVASDRKRQTQRWAAVLVAAAGVVLLAFAWRDGVAGYEAALRVLCVCSETGGLRWDKPPWGGGVSYWYAWLTLMTSGHVAVATFGSLTMLGAATVLPTRRSDATGWARIAVVCTVALVSVLLLIGGPAAVLRAGREGLTRGYWASYAIWTTAEVDVWSVCAGAVLLMWATALAASSRASTSRIGWTAALTVLAIGSVAFLAVRLRTADFEVRSGEYPLGRDDRRLPGTPQGARNARRWVGSCSRGRGPCDFARIDCDKPPAVYAFDFTATSWSDWSMNHPSQPYPPGVLVAPSSALLEPLRWVLDRFRRQGLSTVDAVTMRETRVVHTPMFGDTHLGTWTTVTLAIACLDALTDDVRWGDAVTRCAGSQASNGPSL